MLPRTPYVSRRLMRISGFEIDVYGRCLTACVEKNKGPEMMLQIIISGPDWPFSDTNLSLASVQLTLYSIMRSLSRPSKLWACRPCRS